MTKNYNYAVGRRKATTAVVKLFGGGKGVITIKKPNGNEVSIQDYFGGNIHMLNDALMALDVMGPQYRTQFDAHITIAGGWLAGAADAIKLGIARALISWNSDLRPTLKPYGLLKRDARIKERKKPGLMKARKAHKRSKR